MNIQEVQWGLDPQGNPRRGQIYIPGVYRPGSYFARQLVQGLGRGWQRHFLTFISWLSALTTSMVNLSGAQRKIDRINTWLDGRATLVQNLRQQDPNSVLGLRPRIGVQPYVDNKGLQENPRQVARLQDGRIVYSYYNFQQLLWLASLQRPNTVVSKIAYCLPIFGQLMHKSFQAFSIIMAILDMGLGSLSYQNLKNVWDKRSPYVVPGGVAINNIFTPVKEHSQAIVTFLTTKFAITIQMANQLLTRIGLVKGLQQQWAAILLHTRLIPLPRNLLDRLGPDWAGVDFFSHTDRLQQVPQTTIATQTRLIKLDGQIIELQQMNRQQLRIFGSLTALALQQEIDMVKVQRRIWQIVSTLQQLPHHLTTWSRQRVYAQIERVWGQKWKLRDAITSIITGDLVPYIPSRNLLRQYMPLINFGVQARLLYFGRYEPFSFQRLQHAYNPPPISRDYKKSQPFVIHFDQTAEHLQVMNQIWLTIGRLKKYDVQVYACSITFQFSGQLNPNNPNQRPETQFKTITIKTVPGELPSIEQIARGVKQALQTLQQDYNVLIGLLNVRICNVKFFSSRGLLVQPNLVQIQSIGFKKRPTTYDWPSLTQTGGTGQCMERVVDQLTRICNARFAVPKLLGDTRIKQILHAGKLLQNRLSIFWMPQLPQLSTILQNQFMLFVDVAKKHMQLVSAQQYLTFKQSLVEPQRNRQFWTRPIPPRSRQSLSYNLSDFKRSISQKHRVYWDIQTWAAHYQPGKQRLQLFSIAAVYNKDEFFAYVQDDTLSQRNRVRKQFVDFLVQCLNQKFCLYVWGFNSGRFDLSYVLQQLLNRFGPPVVAGTWRDVKYCQFTIPNLISDKPDSKIVFMDVAKILTDNSLMGWCKCLLPDKKQWKLQFDVKGKDWRQMREVIKQVKKYNIQDCLATRAIHQQFCFLIFRAIGQIAGDKFDYLPVKPSQLISKATLPSTAFMIYQAMHAPKNNTIHLQNNKDVCSYERRYMKGGMTIKFYDGHMQQDIYYVDFSSLYASIAARLRIPGLFTLSFGDRNKRQILELLGKGRHFLFFQLLQYQFDQSTYLPFWAMKDSKTGNIYTLKGKDVITTSQQYYYLNRIGKWPVRWKVGKSWGYNIIEPTDANHPLRQFVQGWFKQRKRAQEIEGKKSSLVLTIKKVLNSLFGILSPKQVPTTTWQHAQVIETFEEWSHSNWKNQPFMLQQGSFSQISSTQLHDIPNVKGLFRIGACITSGGRRAIHQIVQKLGPLALYIDTDSCMTTYEGVNMLFKHFASIIDRSSFQKLQQIRKDAGVYQPLQMPLCQPQQIIKGTNLGQLVFESDAIISGTFLAAKSYILEVEPKTVPDYQFIKNGQKVRDMRDKHTITRTGAFIVKIKGVMWGSVDQASRQALLPKLLSPPLMCQRFEVGMKTLQRIWSINKKNGCTEIIDMYKGMTVMPKRKFKGGGVTAPYESIEEYQKHMRQIEMRAKRRDLFDQ